MTAIRSLELELWKLSPPINFIVFFYKTYVLVTEYLASGYNLLLNHAVGSNFYSLVSEGVYLSSITLGRRNNVD